MALIYLVHRWGKVLPARKRQGTVLATGLMQPLVVVMSLVVVRDRVVSRRSEQPQGIKICRFALGSQTVFLSLLGTIL